MVTASRIAVMCFVANTVFPKCIDLLPLHEDGPRMPTTTDKPKHGLQRRWKERKRMGGMGGHGGRKEG